MEKFFKILKPITIILLFIWIGVALIGCKAPKVIEKEKIITKDSISYVQSYRDTTIYYSIPGDTIHDSVNIYISKGLINSKPITLQNDFAISTAYVKDSKLNLSLVAKDTTLQIKLDSAIKVISYYRKLYESHNYDLTKEVEVSKTPWYVKLLLMVLSLFSFYIVILYIKTKILNL